MNKKGDTKRLGNYWTVAAMAEALGVAESTLMQFCRSHGVKLTKLGATSLVTLDALADAGYRARIGLVRKLIEAGE